MPYVSQLFIDQKVVDTAKKFGITTDSEHETGYVEEGQ